MIFRRSLSGPLQGPVLFSLGVPLVSLILFAKDFYLVYNAQRF